MEETLTEAPKPIGNAMQSTGYSPGRFWAVRLISLLAVVSLLWLFHNLVAPKLGIYDVRLLVLSLTFATLAVSLNLINGVTGQFSIGHAAFYLIGAITAGKLSVLYFKGSYNQPAWLILMVLAGGIASAIAGLMVGLPSLRLRGDYLAVATLGFGEIVNVFLRNQDGGPQSVTLTAVVGMLVVGVVLFGYSLLVRFIPEFKGAPGTIVGVMKFLVALAVMRLSFLGVLMFLGPTLDKFGKLDTGGAYGLQDVPKLTQIYFIILLFIGTIAISRNLLKSAHGLSFLAVREDELAADATGVSTTNIKVTAFALGAAIAGMAGALFAHYNGTVSPDDFKMDVSFMLVAMVVIGGTGSITGAALAGIALKLLEEGLRKLPKIPAIDLYSMVIVAILLFLAYRIASQRGWLRLDRALFVPFAILGIIGTVGLGYLIWLTYKAEGLSVVIKAGAIALMAGAIIGMVFTRARNVALPRFGLLAVCLALIYVLTPFVARGLHGVSAIEKLIGGTLYEPHDLRWAVFSIALVFVMILRSQGLLGHHEFSWTFLRNLFGRRVEVVPA
jgi:ABC-type branched-subunit amino acid transport system permease subunit